MKQPLIPKLRGCLLGLVGCLLVQSSALAEERPVRIVLVGDSTVAPNGGWGPAFAQFLGDGASSTNLARGGRSSKSYLAEGTWEKALAAKGDYYLIQFGHNDQPGKGPERETDPATTYRANLLRCIEDARAIGATPVLITSLTRRNFSTNNPARIDSTLTPYVQAVKKLATDKQVPLIDLHARSIALCEKLGPAGTAKLNPIKPDGSPDTTHLDAAGSEVFARIVVEELRQVVPALAPVLLAELRGVSPVPDFSLVGFATLGGGTTGGAGGLTNTVTTAAAFTAAVGAPGAATILVAGKIELVGDAVRIKSDKTILGVGTNAAVVGTLSIVDAGNIILRNLHLSSPPGVSGRDALNTSRAHHLWVDHCDFGECTDGQFDITHGSDFITVSWCRFTYTNAANSHRLSMLIGNSDRYAAEDTGKLRVTLHHNWLGTLVRERMPRVRFGQVHIFNTYYAAPGNNYCIGLGRDSQVRLESSSFDAAKRPWRDSTDAKVAGATPGRIAWNADNVFAATEVPDWAPNAEVFQPPYPYRPDVGASVKELVTKHAGAGRGPFAPK